MSMPRRSGPGPAAIIFGSAALAVAIFLAILALRGDVVAQLRDVWASFFPPLPATSQGAEIRQLYDIVFYIAVAIFLLVEGLIVFAVIRYRRRPGQDELPPQIHGHNLLEIVWTAVPALIVVVLFVLSWQTLNSVDARSPSAEVKVRAVAARFQWTFEYLTPDGGQVAFTQIAPEMVVPAGRTVQVSLRSPDVIHAFYVPRFLFKRDVIPGHENVFDFTIDASEAGQTFRGQCAELCGPQHWAMQFTVKAVTPAEFDAWYAEQRDRAAASPSPASPVPSAPASPGPGASPGASPSAPAGVVLEISAQNIAFDKAELRAPANTPFQIRFTNNDAGIPHNVAIHEGSPTGPELWRGEIFNGVETRVYDVPALPAGTYGFICTVHPNMTGTLIVE